MLVGAESTAFRIAGGIAIVRFLLYNHEKKFNFFEKPIDKWLKCGRVRM